MNFSTEPAALRPVQLVWLAAAIFIVSAGYGALMPVLPGWLGSLMPGASGAKVARHVGFFSAVYAAGVLVGAPVWGALSDRVGRARILSVGLVGYVVTMLLLLAPTLAGLSGLYALRGATGFFVAAVVPVVSALVAEHTPADRRARRFAWFSAVSLLGFLFGPGLSALFGVAMSWTGEQAASAVTMARGVIVLTALLGAVMMLGLAWVLPAPRARETAESKESATQVKEHSAPLCWLSGVVTLVLAGFELGIVLQGQQHPDMTSRQLAMMFAECSMVMLFVNALLFLTGVLEKTSARQLMALGLILAMAGLAVMTWHRSESWLYLGISLTSAGTGLVMPVVAYQAAGLSRSTLGSTMGWLAAAAGLGQTVGSSVGGWLFGLLAQGSFAWLIGPLASMLVLLLLRPTWWSTHRDGASRHGSAEGVRQRTDARPP